VLIDRRYAEPMRHEPDARVSSLADAVDWILSPDAVSHLRVKLFADGAALGDMVALAQRPYIRGFTTNPTLMHKAGVHDYAAFARAAIAAIPDRPISFEVFSDEFAGMEAQAHEIAAWGPHVYVKIPITNTRGESSCGLIRRLSHAGVHVNVTAVMTSEQVAAAVAALRDGAPAIISIFAGRIADTGRDPMTFVSRALSMSAPARSIEILWASPREVLNVVQAEAIGCHIITLTTDLVNRLALLGRSLDAFSLDTVRMFRDDALKAGFSLSRQAQPL
jgi:transaldolase